MTIDCEIIISYIRRQNITGYTSIDDTNRKENTKPSNFLTHAAGRVFLLF